MLDVRWNDMRGLETWSAEVVVEARPQTKCGFVHYTTIGLSTAVASEHEEPT